MLQIDLSIIAACKGYDIENVKPWVESLNSTGFSGNIIILLYDNDIDLIKYLHEYNIKVVNIKHEGYFHVATQRFYDYAQYLKNTDFEGYILHTDIRDVIFQKDPSKIFTENLEKGLMFASTEGVKYNNEDWNGDGLQYHFGEKLFTEMKDFETLCSGVFGGRKDVFTQFCEDMYNMVEWTQEPGGFIDQHFYNLLIRKVYNSIVYTIPADQPYVANIGTLASTPFNSPDWSTGPHTPYNSYERFRKGNYIENMLVELPQMIDGKVCTPSGEPYTIVHQYNRYEPWKQTLLKKYI